MYEHLSDGIALRRHGSCISKRKEARYNVDEMPPIEGKSTTLSRTRIYHWWCLSGPYKWL